MKAWNGKDVVTALSLRNEKSVREIAKILGKNEKAVSGWFCRRGFYKRRRYGETEQYMIANFGSKAKTFIADKSENALRIKKSRLKSCPF
jgi:hypothetical protein